MACHAPTPPYASEWAVAQRLSAAQITAVGAFERATVGWFDRAARDYRRIEIERQWEVLSLIGDIVLGPGSPGKPEAHLHAVLGLEDGTTRGGHLLEGRVYPTLEVVIRETPAELRKTYRPDVGLAPIDPGDPEGAMVLDESSRPIPRRRRGGHVPRHPGQGSLARLQHCELVACGWMAGRRLPGA